MSIELFNLLACILCIRLSLVRCWQSTQYMRLKRSLFFLLCCYCAGFLIALAVPGGIFFFPGT